MRARHFLRPCNTAFIKLKANINILNEVSSKVNSVSGINTSTLHRGGAYHVNGNEIKHPYIWMLVHRTGKWNSFTDIAKTSPHTFWRSICGLSGDNICNASLLISLALSSTRWPVQDTNRWGEPKPPHFCRNPEDRKRESLCSLHYKWLQMTMLMK